jgi:glucose/arabinose dehydrogenase
MSNVDAGIPGAPEMSRLLTTGALWVTSMLGAAAIAGQGFGPKPVLPEPNPSHQAANFATAVGWTQGQSPATVKDFSVASFADGLEHPRWLSVLPGGDVLVAEASMVLPPPKTDADRVKYESLKKAGALAPNANRLTLLRDSNGDGTVDTRSVFLDQLNQPTGMVLVGNTFFVANNDGVWSYPYESGAQKITGRRRKILELPAGGNHWARTLVANPAGTKLYVGIGSASNIAELGLRAEDRRAAILESNLDGSNARVYAFGLRNPQGMDWEPATSALWTVVNERDGLGEDLVPDYLTRVLDGGFYGWPFSYFGGHVDPRVKPERKDLVAKALTPDYALGAHTASLGLAFARGTGLPPQYRSGAFVAQHGSWNRTEFSGYKVVFVPFENGRPTGAVPLDFLTGFLSKDGKGDAYGRPAGLAIDASGAVLVADDVGNIVWRVSYQAARTLDQSGNAK